MSAHQLLAPNALPLALAVAVACNAAIVAAIVCAKLLRERRTARASIVRDQTVNSVLPLLEEEEGTEVPLPPPRSRDAAAALEAVVGVIAAVRGTAREKLIALLERCGYVEDLVRRSRSRDPVRRSECAMLLGATQSRKAVPALTALVERDPEAEVRMIAADALGAIANEQSVPLLISALNEPGRFQQLRIAGVLAAMGPVAVPQLEAALGRDDVPLPLLLDILCDIGIVHDPAPVLALLAHRSPEVRARAAALLGAAGIVDSVPDLAFASRDPFWYVRLRIIKALARLGVPDSGKARAAYFNTLEHLTLDDDWRVRRAATGALSAAAGVR